MPHPFRSSDLRKPLLPVTQREALTIGDACEGIAIIGGTGSGKTSTSGGVIARHYLAAGFGGLVLTAKPDERALWQRYAAETGRDKDLVIFAPGSGPSERAGAGTAERTAEHGFNFLDYEMTRGGPGAGDTENIVDLFFHILEASGKQTGHNREEPFWTHSLKQLIRNAVDLVHAARGTVGLQEIKDVIKSAAQSRDEARGQAWQEESFCFRCIVEAEKKPRSDSRQRDYAESADYWLETFPALSEKTRSIIVVMFLSMADYFLRGKLHSLFCKGTTIRPEDTENGKIIILDLPVKEYNDRGRFAQLLFKLCWMRAIERRDTAHSPRPVFLWQDEAQNFCLGSGLDAQFQATARGSRACVVSLFQNLPVLFDAYGKTESGKWQAMALLGNLQTKIFHANTDVETTQWAADVIGKEWQARVSTSLNASPVDTMAALTGAATNQGHGIGTSESLEYEVQPNEFKRLRTGGYRHQGMVDAILIQSGRQWEHGKDYLRLAFKQEGF